MTLGCQSARFWTFFLCACLTLALGQDGLTPLIAQEVRNSGGTVDDSLPPPLMGFAQETEEFSEESPSGEIVPANFLDELHSPDGDSVVAALSKRLAEVEKQLKKRDEADSKKAGEFPTFKITGFLQLDSANYSQEPLNIATVGRAQNGTGFRRARLAVNGKVAELTNYQLEMDFATAGRPSFSTTTSSRQISRSWVRSESASFASRSALTH